MKFTLDDLIVLESRLAPVPGLEVRDASPLQDVEISWAVSARMTPPHLPLLRGAELVLIPPRVNAELAAQIDSLIYEADARGAAAFAFESSDPALAGVLSRLGAPPVLIWSGPLNDESETTINRLLTERRGDLYRIGSALERELADLAVNRGGIVALIRVAGEVSGLPLSVVNAAGQQVAATRASVQAAVEEDFSQATIDIELPRGATLRIGPLQPRERATAKFLADRLAGAAAAALQRDDEARPRGSHRADAAAVLLSGALPSASDQRAAALALGFDPDAIFLVAITPAAADATLSRALSPLGSVHPVKPSNGLHAVVVAIEGRQGGHSLGKRIADVKQRWDSEHSADQLSLALSAPAFGVASLPGASREAWFVANLQQRSAFSRRAVSFDSIDDVGAMRLLYELREAPELRQFISQALGELAERDKRGTLRATLKAFLESGGSQVDAATRLGIHRNTLAYRLRRIGELVGRDVADPASWLTLHLALRAADLLEVQVEPS